MNQPLVSIIIPTFNREILIQQAIESVIGQTYQNWECLVIDDGSTDQTLKILDDYFQKDSRILIFTRNRMPKGAPTCRNIGLENAKGEYVIFLDSDDYLMPSCLEKRIKIFNQFPKNDFVVFPMGVKTNNKIVPKEIPISNNYLINFLSADLPWSIMCPIWRTTFVRCIYGFKEGYKRFNDPELMIKALLKKSVSFKIHNGLDYDTVYVPSEKDSRIFIKKVYDSLILFIPDIIYHLEENNQSNLRPYLQHYLHLWFKHIYLPSGSSKLSHSLNLINIFRKKGVINFKRSFSLTLRLFLYVISKKFMKNPIDKLTNLSYFLPEK